MARRLPIFLVLDVSESMAGQDLKSLNDVVASITAELRSDPFALETVWISVIAFAGKAKVLVPLQELVSFFPVELPVGGGTALGQALTLLMDTIDSSINKTAGETKGDWKPVVYLITDGAATDDTNTAIKRWKADFQRKATLVAISVGGGADLQILKQITENVLDFDSKAENAYARFAKWVSQSISTQSQKVAEGGDALPPALQASRDEVVRPVEEMPATQRSSTHPRNVILLARCNKDRQPYLIKYGQASTSAERTSSQNVIYDTVETVRINDSYFEWSANNAEQPRIDASRLQANGTNCPYCQSSYWGVCQCQSILCVPGPGNYTCPWCSKGIRFGSEGGGDFSLGRGLG